MLFELFILNAHLVAVMRLGPLNFEISGEMLKIGKNQDIQRELQTQMFWWVGQAMVLGSFQCRGVLLLWHIVGQGPAVLTAGA